MLIPIMVIFACLCSVSPTNYSHLIIYQAQALPFNHDQDQEVLLQQGQDQEVINLTLAFRKWNCKFLTCWYVLEEHTLSFLSVALFPQMLTQYPPHPVQAIGRFCWMRE